MTFSERAVEAAAKALRERDMAGRITVPWGKIQKGQKKKWIERGQAALTAALAVDGLALVPKEPTDDVMKAGYEAWIDDKYDELQAPLMYAVWTAMLTAASDGEVG